MWCVEGELTNNRDDVKYVSCDTEYQKKHSIPDGHWFRPIRHCLLFADGQKNTDRDGYDWTVTGGCDFDHVCEDRYAANDDKLIRQVS